MLFFKHYIYFISALMIFYLAGFVLLRLFVRHTRLDYMAEAFLSLLCGLVAVVVVYSACQTGLRTVNLGFVLVALILMLYNREAIFNFRKYSLQHAFLPLKSVFRASGLLWAIGTFCYVIKAAFLFDIFTGDIFLPHPDVIIYSDISEHLLITGYENIYNNYGLLDPGHYAGTSPYHYFELWLNALVAQVSGFLAFATFESITVPLILTVAGIGAAAFAEAFKAKNVFIISLSVLLILFIQGVYILPLFSEVTRDWLISASAPPVQKQAVLYMFILAGYLFLHRRQYVLSFALFSVLPLVSITALPGMVCAFLLYIVSVRFFWKRPIAEDLKLIILFAGVMLFIALFYGFTGIKSSQQQFISVLSHPGKYIEQIKSLTPLQLRILINTMIATPLQVLFLYLPAVIIALYACIRLGKIIQPYAHLNKSALYITLVVFCGSYIAWLITSPMMNSFQFYIVLSLPFLNIALFVFLLQLIISVRRLSFGSAAVHLFVLICLLQSSYFYVKIYLTKSHYSIPAIYSGEFLNKVRLLISGISNPVGLYIPSFREMENEFTRMPLYGHVFVGRGRYLKLYMPRATQFTLSVHDIPEYRRSVRNVDLVAMVESHPFHHYLRSRIHVLPDTGMLKALFLKEQRIQYLVAAKNAVVDEQIKRKIKECVEDSASGEIFCTLKQ